MQAVAKCMPCHVSLITTLHLSYSDVVTTILHSVALVPEVIAKLSL